MLTYDEFTDSRPSLTKVLTEHLPNHRGRKGWVSPQVLGPALGTTKQAVSRWLLANELPPQRVNPLCNLEGSTQTKAHLLPFVDLG